MPSYSQVPHRRWPSAVMMPTAPFRIYKLLRCLEFLNSVHGTLKMGYVVISRRTSRLIYLISQVVALVGVEVPGFLLTLAGVVHHRRPFCV